MALAAATLFCDGTIAAGDPQFAANATISQKVTFERVPDKAMLANDGVWLGTFINLDRDYRRGGLINKQTEIRHSHLALWGEADSIIPKETVQRMESEMPNCQSRFYPGVGHSMNLEMPLRYAQIVSEFLSE